MDVVLKQDVARIGTKFETVTVSDGYARNYLIPRGLAVTTASSEAAALSQQRKRKEDSQAAQQDARRAGIERLNGATVTIHGKANDDGTLFKRIRAADIVEAITAQHVDGFTTDDIELEAPITTLGTHEVAVSAEGQAATITVTIVSDEA